MKRLTLVDPETGSGSDCYAHAYCNSPTLVGLRMWLLFNDIQTVINPLRDIIKIKLDNE